MMEINDNGTVTDNSKLSSTLWLGLSSYQEENANIFFGRSKESEELFYKIYDNVVTTVYGVSGVGKTSLLRAGVFPKLRQKEFFPIYLRLDHSRSSSSYIKQIIELISSSLEKHYCSIKEIASLPENASENLWTWLHRHEFYDVMDSKVRLVLVFDQFEEIFTISEKDDTEIHDAITQICDAAGDHLPAELEELINKDNVSLTIPVQAEYRMVLSLRDDFIARLDEMSSLCPPLRQNRIAVKAMNEINAHEVIFNDKTKDIISESVCENIIDAVSENSLNKHRNFQKVIEPALLSLFCEQINFCRLEQSLPQITEELVQENKDNILVKFYDNAMHKVSPHTSEILEKELVSDSGFRLLKAVEDLKIPKVDIEKLVNLRLLRTDNRNGLQYIEFCHDILIPVVKAKRIERYLLKKTEYCRRILHAVIIPLFVLNFFLWSFFFLFVLEYKTYYKNWIKINGIPYGFNRLSKNDVKHRDFSYEFKTKGIFDYFLNLKNYRKDFNWYDWKTYIPYKQSTPYRITIVNNKRIPYPLNERHFNTYIWSSNDESKVNNRFDLSGITEDELRSVVILDFSYYYYKNQKRPKSIMGKNKNDTVVWIAYYMPRYDNYGKEINSEELFQIQNELTDNQHNNKTQPPENPFEYIYSPKEESVHGMLKNMSIISDDLIYFITQNGFPILRKVQNSKDESYYTLCYVAINYDKSQTSFSGYEKEWIWIDPQMHEGMTYTRGLDNACKRVFDYTRKNKYEFVTTIKMTSQEFDYNTGMFKSFYDAAGNCSFEETFDQYGNAVQQSHFDKEGNLIKISKDGGDYDTIKDEYDEYGNCIQWTFWKKNDDIQSEQVLVKATWDGRIHRITQNFSNGNHINTFYFNKDDEPSVNLNGISRYENEYNTTNTLNRRILYSLPDYGIWGDMHIMRVERFFNNVGNIIKQTYYASENGKELACDSNGISQYENKYDKSGNILIGRVLCSKDGYGLRDNKNVLRMEETFSKDGKLIEKSNYSSLTSAVYACEPNGVCRYKNEYDKNTGKLQRIFLYSLSGHGVWGNKDIMRLERTFNEDGNILEEIHFLTDSEDEYIVDSNGNINYEKLACDSNGISRYVNLYDKYTGKLEGDILYSKKKKGVWGNHNVMRVERQFNTKGQVLNELYYAADKGYVLVKDKNGVCKINYEYNDTGKLKKKTSFYDTSRKSTPNMLRIPKPETMSDSQWEIIQKTYQKNEYSIRNEERNHEIKRKEEIFNKNGKILETTFFASETSDIPSCDSERINIYKYEYDQKTGKLIKQIRYPLDYSRDILHDHNNQIKRIEYLYNENEKVIEILNFIEKTGNKLYSKNFKEKIEYDDQGKRIKHLSYFLDHRLSNNFNIEEATFDVNGKVIKRIVYTQEELLRRNQDFFLSPFTPSFGMPTHSPTIKYEQNGIISIKFYYFNFNDENNISCIEKIYNKDNREIAVIYSSEDGNTPIGDHYGVHKIESTYHENGKIKSRIFYLLSSKETPRKYKDIKRVERIFNKNEKIIEEVFYGDETEIKYATDNGIYKTIYEYNNQNTLIRKILYSLPGQGILNNKNVMRSEIIYDQKHNIIKQIYYGSEKGDNLACTSNGISWYENLYDEQTEKLKIKIEYSIIGIGLWGYKNVMRIEQKYNNSNNVTEIIFYPSEDSKEPICNNDGVYKIEYKYHENGKLKQKTFLSLPNVGIKGQKDIMKVEKIYDMNKNLIEEKSYNHSGVLMPGLNFPSLY